MLIVAFKICFILVNGQSLQVTPDPAIGDLGGSVDIIWTIMKVEPSDKVTNTRLYIGTNFTTEKLLYEGSGAADLAEGDAAERFGNRMKATFEDPKYTLTLSNLNYNDTITFTLVVNLEDASLNPRQPSIRSIKIIKVRGKYFLRKILELITYFNSPLDETG